MKKFKDIIIVGFTLFSIFFGAGNLIFPPYIGVTTGEGWLTSLFGFIIGDVGLIILSIYAITKVGSFTKVLGKAGKRFAGTLEVLIMLCLGPILVIPRTAATTFEMSIDPLVDFMNPIVFAIIFFAINLILTIRPSKILDIIGKVLTPVLLLALSILIIKGIITPVGEINNALNNDDLFVGGLTQGYQTMDPLGVGGITALMITSIIARGYTKKEAKTITRFGALVAAIGLILVYGGLCYIGSTASTIYGSDVDQATLLVNITHMLLGKTRTVVISIVVAFACLTTSVGLTSVTAKFFSDITGDKLKYKNLVIGISVFSAIISNFGVSKIIAISVPILTVIYPVTIILIFMNCFHKLFKRNQVYMGAAYAVLLISILTVIDNLGIEIEFVRSLPFANLGFNWIVPGIIGGIIGFALGKRKDITKKVQDI